MTLDELKLRFGLEAHLEARVGGAGAGGRAGDEDQFEPLCLAGSDAQQRAVAGEGVVEQCEALLGATLRARAVAACGGAEARSANAARAALDSSGAKHPSTKT